MKKEYKIGLHIMVVILLILAGLYIYSTYEIEIESTEVEEKVTQEIDEYTAGYIKAKMEDQLTIIIKKAQIDGNIQLGEHNFIRKDLCTSSTQ